MRRADPRAFCAVLACAALACAPHIAVVAPRTGLASPASQCRATRPATRPALAREAPDAPTLTLDYASGDDRGVHAFGARWSVDLPGGARATGGEDARVVFWEGASGVALGGVTVGATPASALLDGSRASLFVATEGDDVVALDAGSRAVRWRTRVPASRCHGVALSPDGRFVTEGVRDGCTERGRLAFRVVATTGALLAPVLYDPPWTAAGDVGERPVRAVAFDPASRLAARLVVTRWERTQSGCIVSDEPRATALELFDAETGARRAVLPDPPAADAELEFAPDGRTLFARTAAPVLRRWSVETLASLDDAPAPAAVSTREGVDQGVQGARDVHVVRRLAAARDTGAGAWTTDDGVVWVSRDDARACALAALPAERPWVSALALDPAGATLLLAHNIPVDATVERWDVARGARLDAVRLAAPESRAVALLPDGHVVFEFLGDERGHALLDPARPSAPRYLSTTGVDAFGLEDARFSADGATVYAGPRWDAQFFRAWDVRSGRTRFELTTRVAHSAVALSPDERWLFLEPLEGVASVWDVTSHRVHAALRAQPREVASAAAFSVDGALLAVAARDGVVRVFRAADGALLNRVDLGARVDTPTTLAFTRAHLWIGTARGAVFRYRVAR